MLEKVEQEIIGDQSELIPEEETIAEDFLGRGFVALAIGEEGFIENRSGAPGIEKETKQVLFGEDRKGFVGQKGSEKKPANPRSIALRPSEGGA
jgi:hypothetical protein